MDAGSRYREARIAHWNKVAQQMDTWKGWGGYYHKRLIQLYQYLVPTGQRMLEIGCGTGDLLSALKPAPGVGVDFSGEMIKRARERHPELHFIEADAHDLRLDEQFDVIILSDVMNDLWDVQTVFEQIASLSMPETRVIINSYSRLWELPFALVKGLGMANPTLYQNWLTPEDITNLLHLAGFEVIRHRIEILWPLKTPLIDNLVQSLLSEVMAV